MAEGNIQLLARALNITTRRIQQLVKEGMPKGERGVYELHRCMVWYIGYLQKIVAARQDDEVKDETIQWTRERTRLAREQADSTQLKNAELRGDLIRRQVVEQVIQEPMTVLRTNALALSSKIAAECESRTAPEIKSIIDREIRQLLENVAGFDFRAGSRKAMGSEGSPGTASAAAADGQ